MTVNTYIIEQIGSIKNKGYRESFLRNMLVEDKSMEIRCKNILDSVWGSLTSSYSYYSLSSEEVSTVISVLFYMHTKLLTETLCVVGTFLDNLEWPKEFRTDEKKEQEKIVCKFIHGIISGLVTAVNQYTRDLNGKSPITTEKRVVIFITELLYRQSLLKLDVPDYRGCIENKSERVHDFGDKITQYLLPNSGFAEKNLRPKLFAKEMQKRKFEKVTCKPAKQVMDQILQTNFSAIEDYNIRTALVCRGLK